MSAPAPDVARHHTGCWRYHDECALHSAKIARYLSGDGPLACQCTGCQLARAGHLQVWTDIDGIVTVDAEGRVR